MKNNYQYFCYLRKLIYSVILPITPAALKEKHTKELQLKCFKYNGCDYYFTTTFFFALNMNLLLIVSYQYVPVILY